MSTKTSIKRIALVAVSALGFGLLSLVPAKAEITAVALSGPANARAADHSAITLTTTVTDDGGAEEYVLGIELTSAPAGINLTDLETQGAFTGDYDSGLDDADATAYDDAELFLVEDTNVSDIIDEAALDAEGNTFEFTIPADVLTIPGDYTFTAFAILDAGGDDETVTSADAAVSDTFTLKVLPRANFATSGTSTLTITPDQTAYRSNGGTDVTITTTRPAAGAGSNANHQPIIVVTQSQDSDLPVGTVIRITDGDTAMTNLTSEGSTLYDIDAANTLKLDEDFVLSTGSYSLTGWVDANGDFIYNAGEAWGTASFTIGGDPATLGVSLTPTTIEPGVDGVSTGSVCVTLTDEDGNGTLLTGAENITLSEVSSTGAAATTPAVLADTTPDAGEELADVVGRETNVYCTTMTGLDGLTASLSIKAVWSGDTDITATGSMTRYAAVSATALAVTSTTGLDYT